ncbi:MAG: sigma 54-interacting transcriptional regulator [Myxococcales bacterium]|nr:sigma 54-interacting transcriptional regulator [Myxococcales bacterium]
MRRGGEGPGREVHAQEAERDREARPSRRGEREERERELPRGADERDDQALALLDRVAGTERNLLLRGETGSGKELFARRAHARSGRASGPFVALNAAAIPAGLVERELFGHEAGAFSDAGAAAPGAVERAEGGTLFLDEVGDLAPEAQAKLLRFLEARTYRRVGGIDERRADVRVVAATHHELERMVEQGALRADLYYRLDGFTVTVPPLRDRRGDLRLLAERFLAEAAAEEGLLAPRLDAGAWAVLEAHAWPGNVRELRNVMQRLAIFADATVGASVVRGLMRPSEPPEPDAATTLASSRREMDRESILLALARAEGNRTAAARALGISRRSLYYKMRELDIA